MNKLRPYFFGIIGLSIGAILALWLGSANPPDSMHLIGLFIGSISIFYLIVIGAMQFVIFLLRELGYGDKK